MMSKCWRSLAFALSDLTAHVCLFLLHSFCRSHFCSFRVVRFIPRSWRTRQATTSRKDSSSRKRRKGLWPTPCLLLTRPRRSLRRLCPTPSRPRVVPGLYLTRPQVTPRLRCWVLTPAPAPLQAGLLLAITTRLPCLPQGASGLGTGHWLLLPYLLFWSVQGLPMDNSWMDCLSCLRTSGTASSPFYNPWSSARWFKHAWC